MSGREPRQVCTWMGQSIQDNSKRHYKNSCTATDYIYLLSVQLIWEGTCHKKEHSVRARCVRQIAFLGK
jgi:hypothetical protein